jgi:osmoprotectant transport system permease protein
MIGFLDYVAANAGDLLLRTGEHLLLVGVALSTAVIVGLPLGVALSRRRAAAPPVIGGANVLQTIPSLALLGLLVPLPWLGGVGPRPAIVALVAYALLPIIRTTYDGIRGVDPAVREAGVAMGMTDMQLLREVELPMAAGVIMGGIRVATVIGIGVATVAAAIGAGGLGVFIFQGLAMVDNEVILAGAIPAALLALAADFGLGRIERVLSRWRD